MSYRKINVNGTVYEYTIGKKFTKIKDVGIFENSKIGNEIVSFGGVVDGKYDDSAFVPLGIFVVTPAVVRAVIVGDKLPIVFKRKTLDGRKIETSYFMSCPFDAEIYGKTTYLVADYETYSNLADDI